MTAPAIRHRGLALAALVTASGAALAAGLPSPSSDEWLRLIQAGDRVVAAAGPPVTGPLREARIAYLLAFHRAQDLADAEHMLVAADRLHALGDHDLAAHVRRAARAVAKAP